MKRRDFLKAGAAAAFTPAVMRLQQAKAQTGEEDLSAATARHEALPGPVDRLAADATTPLLPKLPMSVESLAPPRLAVIPMTLAERLKRQAVPLRGVCSTGIGHPFTDTLLSGNGPVLAEWTGHPYLEEVQLRHERLMLPWARPFEAPRVSSVLPEIQKLLLAGKYREGLDLAFEAMQAAGLPMNTKTHQTIAACTMQITDASPEAEVREYLRTADFESGEVRVLWEDTKGAWERRSFVSHPDDLVVQWIRPPAGKQLDLTVSLKNPGVGPHMGPLSFSRNVAPDTLVFTGRFDPAVNNNGYAVVTRIVRQGGEALAKKEALHVRGAQSLLLMTRVAWFRDFSEDQVASLAAALKAVTPDYDALLKRHRPRQSEIMNRVVMDFGGAEQHGLSGEELLSLQRTGQGYAPALLEKVFDMGRYWLLAASGEFPAQPMAGEVNININLQVAHGCMAALPEAMMSYFRWIESLLPDCRKNAENIFGARGAVYPILPNKDMGVSFLYASTVNAGTWPHPYWISAGGWCYSPFWDYYLTTGDEQFLRERVVPGLKELALFYEDFLKIRDARGNFVFVPSFSPENWPEHAEPSPAPGWPLLNEGWPNMPAPTPLVINSAMDIMVCREVLTHLIEAAAILKIEQDNVDKWKQMLSQMPPYLTTADGTLKEWAWPGLEENYDQRHVSHLYGAWPADEIDPGRTPELARAALLADRKRGPSNNSAHGLCHRALAGARLKDAYMVDFELRQLLQQGYFNGTLRSSHNPYRSPMPDAQGGVPTLLMEMLLYARPGVIELLPALPQTLPQGRVRGLLIRTFAKLEELAWDLPSRSITLRVNSLRDQEITLVAWHGIASVHARGSAIVGSVERSRTCKVQLRRGVPAMISIGLVSSKPRTWADGPEVPKRDMPVA